MGNVIQSKHVQVSHVVPVYINRSRHFTNNYVPDKGEHVVGARSTWKGKESLVKECCALVTVLLASSRCPKEFMQHHQQPAPPESRQSSEVHSNWAESDHIVRLGSRMFTLDDVPACLCTCLFSSQSLRTLIYIAGGQYQLLGVHVLIGTNRWAWLAITLASVLHHWQCSQSCECELWNRWQSPPLAMGNN